MLHARAQSNLDFHDLLIVATDHGDPGALLTGEGAQPIVQCREDLSLLRAETHDDGEARVWSYTLSYEGRLLAQITTIQAIGRFHPAVAQLDSKALLKFVLGEFDA